MNFDYKFFSIFLQELRFAIYDWEKNSRDPRDQVRWKFKFWEEKKSKYTIIQEKLSISNILYDK